MEKEGTKAFLKTLEQYKMKNVNKRKVLVEIPEELKEDKQKPKKTKKKNKKKQRFLPLRNP